MITEGILRLAKMRNVLPINWRRIFASAIAAFPIRSADEQTRLSWARSISTYADVPEIYQGFFEPFLAPGRVFPYSVLTPSYTGFVHRTTEKLIASAERKAGKLLDRYQELRACASRTRKADPVT